MLSKVLLTLLTVTAIAGSAYYYLKQDKLVLTSTGVPSDVAELYTEWKSNNGKLLLGAGEADESKLRVFYMNHLKVQAHNNDPQQTYDMELNQFADLTSYEFSTYFLGAKEAEERADNTDADLMLGAAATPSSVDWRKTSGVVTPVKDQGQCGSCWAFSSTGALEGLAGLNGQKSKSFSEQQLVDCSHWYLNMGCNGGLMSRAFKFVRDHGILTEDKYPYKGVGGSCVQKNGDFKIKSFTNVQSGSTDALKAAIAKQPVSIGVDASNWQLYKSGVFSNCKTQMDHGVLAVGYTSDYWIVKNSWTTKWGESGYIRLAAGNTCGIANTAAYPTM